MKLKSLMAINKIREELTVLENNVYAPEIFQEHIWDLRELIQNLEMDYLGDRFNMIMDELQKL